MIFLAVQIISMMLFMGGVSFLPLFSLLVADEWLKRKLVKLYTGEKKSPFVDITDAERSIN